MSLLHKEVEAFFQYPNDEKTAFTAKVVRKNTLGNLMSEISKNILITQYAKWLQLQWREVDLASKK